MNNTKIAKELIKIADDLFHVEEYKETEHDKVTNILQECSKKFLGDNVKTYIDLSNNLLTSLNHQDLKIDNIDKIIIHLALDDNSDYDADKLIKALSNANKHAKLIQSKIKSELNKDVEIKLNYN